MNQELEQENVFPDCMADAAEAPGLISRRSVFSAMIGGVVACVASILSVPIGRYLLYPLHAKTSGTAWSDLGTPAEFANSRGPVTRTVTLIQQDGWREITSTKLVYVSSDESGQLKVLSATCPHLGCSVSWHADRNRFVCPCHGGEFRRDGERISGPPPRSMDELQTQVKDGKLQVLFQSFRSNIAGRETLS